ncbi:hypothetical protein EON83_01400 [bacterium]|nr:MAG: hypothetical protein EON83_01400 [bacterium]
MIFKLRRPLFLTLLVASVAPAAWAAPQTPTAQITLTPGVSIWLNAAEAVPVQRAARDLARDFQKVLGTTSPITGDRASLNGRTFIEIIGPGAGDEAKRDAQTAIAGREAHGVFVKRDQNGTRVVLQGADMRGTLYAIYTFSEKFLGVKPLWFWASQPPLPQKSIPLNINTDLRFASPSVHWRTWFPNDTDLFNPWKKRSHDNYDALYEAMLRLKLNCMEGSSSDEGSLKAPYPLERSVEMARDRGLAFVGHHVYPLGADYNLWDKFWRQIEHREPPALSIKNVEELKTFWRWHIDLARRNHLEEIWLIGFRGNGDKPFWTSFQDAPKSDRERAAVIDQMMKTQVELVKTATGEAAPLMRTTLYNEMSDFYAAGLLRPPAEPNLIWTFVAARRDHFPAPDAQNAEPPTNQPIGYYLNFQFTSTGAHLAQAEGLWKMERNFRFINGIAPRPLEFSVVNMGNIREFVLEGSANAAMMWDMQDYNSDKFLLEFCRTYFGDDNAPAVAALYRDFYDSYWQQRRPTLPGFERQYIFQDLRMNRVMQRLMEYLKKPGASTEEIFSDGSLDANNRLFNIVPADNGVASKLDALIKGTGQSIKKLTGVVARADALMARLPTGDRTFFNDNLRMQARFLLATNTTTHNLALAVRDAQGTPERSAHLNAAHTAALQMRTALAEAEHGSFENWYGSDHLFDVKARIEDISKLLPNK